MRALRILPFIAVAAFHQAADAANLDLTIKGTYGSTISAVTSQKQYLAVPQPFTITISLPLDSYYLTYVDPNFEELVTQYPVDHLVVTNPLYNLVGPDPGGRGFADGPTPGYSYAYGGVGNYYNGIKDGVYASFIISDSFVDDTSAHQWGAGTEIDFGNGYLGPLDPTNPFVLTPDLLTSYFKGQIGIPIQYLATGWSVNNYDGGNSIITGGIGWSDITAKITAVDGFTGVPEPATWAMMLGGMGAIGCAMRRRANVSVVLCE